VGSPQPRVVEHLVVDDHNRVAIEAAKQSLLSGTPLVFDGPVGAGKTTIAHWLARELWRQDVEVGLYSSVRSDRVRATWLDLPYFWTTADAYVEDVMASWKAKYEPATAADLYSPSGIASSCRRLFIDDLGQEMSTKNRAAERASHITRLIVEREARRLPTWYTTNLTPEDLEAIYGDRAMDRLRAMAGFVAVGGESRRGAA
jgi:DNA replication protein DnaC